MGEQKRVDDVVSKSKLQSTTSSQRTKWTTLIIIYGLWLCGGMDASWIFFSGATCRYPGPITCSKGPWRTPQALANPSGPADTGPAECHPRNGPRSVAACSGSGAGRAPRGPCETRWRPLEPNQQRSYEARPVIVHEKPPLQSATPGDAGCSARLRGQSTGGELRWRSPFRVHRRCRRTSCSLCLVASRRDGGSRGGASLASPAAKGSGP